MAEQTVESGGSITEKLKSLITQTNAWSQALEAAAKEQKASSTEIVGLMDKVTQAMQAGIEVAQQLTGQMESVGAVAARMRAEFQQTSGAASNAFAMGQSRNVNPFAASDYISGASQLTTAQKAEFLRIVTDQDKAALDKMVNDYKKQINDIYTDEYKSIKTQNDQLIEQRRVLGEQIQAELASIKGKENTSDYRKTIALIEKQRMEMSMIGQKSDNLTLQIGQFDQAAQRIEGQISVLNRAWSDSEMQRNLAGSNESTIFTREELLKMVNKFSEIISLSKKEKDDLTTLKNNIDDTDISIGDIQKKLTSLVNIKWESGGNQPTDNVTLYELRRALAESKESSGYTQDELLFLVNKALETGAGNQVDKVALTELIKKLSAATPTKRYQLDLTVGDQKMSAFTELSPEKFLDALLKARGTAI